MPSAGIEPAHPPPEGGALSPELRGRDKRVVRELYRYCQDRAVANTSEIAYFATGCFWGAERRFWNLPGVAETNVGYMGGSLDQPSYESVCTGKTGHAETVRVTFNPEEISYQRLLIEFWTMHDPTSLNRQGGDIGSQYRSAIFTSNMNQFEIAFISELKYQGALSAAGLGEIVTEIESADGYKYWPAEEYHQRYLEKNPNGYDCHSSTGIAFPIS